MKHNDSHEDAVWVRTEPDILGNYRVSLGVSEDKSFFLTPDLALTYARYVLAQVARANYDAKVLRQLMKLLEKKSGKNSENIKNAAQIVEDQRKDRLILTPPPPIPLRLEPGVTPQSKPFLKIAPTGEEVQGQWSVEDGISHAVAVISATEIAYLDAVYRTTLVGLVGLDDATARAVVGALAEE